jgi:hypothetical protein
MVADATRPTVEPKSADGMMTVAAAVKKGGANDPPSAASVLDDLHARLAELMEDVEYLHGAPTPGAPWLLLCRNSDMLLAGQPTSYDDLYMDMMQTYTGMRPTPQHRSKTRQECLSPTRALLRNHRELQKDWRPPYGVTRDAIPTRGPSSQS